MSEKKKKPLITRERYRAYLEKEGKEPKVQKVQKNPKTTKEPKRQNETEASPESRRARVKESKGENKADKPKSFRKLMEKKHFSKESGQGSGQPKSRLTAKEKGRRLDKFYNWAILLVLIAIILVFVLAFVI